MRDAFAFRHTSRSSCRYSPCRITRVRALPYRYPGSGIISYLEGPVRLSILDIAILMIIVSDNTSTNLCIDYAGIDKTNDMLRSLGVDNITLRRKMQDTESVVANRENVGTPDDCVLLLEHLYNGKPTQNSAERCFRT